MARPSIKFPRTWLPANRAFNTEARMLSQARSLNGRTTPFTSCDQPSGPGFGEACGASMSQPPTSFTTTRSPLTSCAGCLRSQLRETPDFFRMRAASRPISPTATREYRPSGIRTAVTWVDRGGGVWPTRTVAAQNIRASVERTWSSVTNSLDKEALEPTKLRTDYIRNL